jgi:hypothetical protein
MGLQEKNWSEGVVKWMVWLSGVMDFEMAEQVLRQIGQVNVSDTSIWRCTQERGERFQKWAEKERAQAMSIPRSEESLQRFLPKGRMGVAMDGGMIHIRGEGWKELKVGSVFEVEVIPTLDEETRDVEELGHAVHTSYVAHLGGPEVFGEVVWAEAWRRGWEQAVESAVIGDGAPWIWNLAEEHFYDSHQIVDWYHATEHLAVAGHLLHGEGTEEAQQWFKGRKTVLFQGHALRIAQELLALAGEHPEVAEGLEREGRYFQNNHRRMNYQEMREKGWPIGSGMVESGIKQFKARFSGPGMRWSRPGAERLLLIRAAIMSGRFDSTWQQACTPPPN